jgi:hypothetical protein
VTNQTSYSNVRTEGESYFTEFNNGTQVTPFLPFTFLGIQTISNSTDAEIRFAKWLSVHAGYDYDDRRIRSIEGGNSLGQPPTASTPIEQTNRLHAGVLGFRFKPFKPVTVSLDGEVGRQSKPFYPISDGNYQVFRGRIEYKRKAFRVGAFAKTNYNINSDALTSYASRSRQYGIDGSWTASDWFSIDGGYGKLHLNTLGGIDYFVGFTDISGESSYYVSNIHTANLGARFSIRKRADFYAGYSHVQDVGDGRATPFGSKVYSVLPAFQAAQTFPLRYLSPQVRLSVKLNQRLRWNVGYQYYGYKEEFSTLQNYRVHTGYSSLSWSF